MVYVSSKFGRDYEEIKKRHWNFEKLKYINIKISYLLDKFTTENIRIKYISDNI